MGLERGSGEPASIRSRLSGDPGPETPDGDDGPDEPLHIDRAKEFGQFLRSRRAKITPEQAGFPVGARRRSKGLRREEVAVLAGLSPTWYAYLEQGRKIRPSPEVLDSLARVLDLTEDERRYMHLLAVGHPPAPTSTEAVITASDELWDLVKVIGNSDHPVYIGNQYADVIAWNEATTAYYTDFGQFPLERRNMLLWLLTAPEARERIVDWVADVKDVVARLRSAYALRQHDSIFEKRVRLLSRSSPEFGSWWHERDVVGQQARLRRLTLPGGDTQAYRLVTLRVADEGFSSAIVHIPVDNAGDSGGHS